jgi:hypothetical protein
MSPQEDSTPLWFLLRNPRALGEVKDWLKAKHEEALDRYATGEAYIYKQLLDDIEKQYEINFPRKEPQIKVPWDFAGVSENEYYSTDKKCCLFKDCNEPKEWPSVFCAAHKDKYGVWLQAKENASP